MAQTDARLMAELQSALSREDGALISVNPAQSHAVKIIRERLNYI
jgi:hypothetical protein